MVSSPPDDELPATEVPDPVPELATAPVDADALPEDPDALSTVVAAELPLGFEVPLEAAVRLVLDASVSVAAGVFVPHPATKKRPTPYTLSARIKAWTVHGCRIPIRRSWNPRFSNGPSCR